MAIRLDERLREFKCAHLIKPAITNAVSYLAELGSKNIHDLPQSAQLK